MERHLWGKRKLQRTEDRSLKHTNTKQIKWLKGDLARPGIGKNNEYKKKEMKKKNNRET